MENFINETTLTPVRGHGDVIMNGYEQQNKEDFLDFLAGELRIAADRDESISLVMVHIPNNDYAAAFQQLNKLSAKKEFYMPSWLKYEDTSCFVQTFPEIDEERVEGLVKSINEELKMYAVTTHYDGEHAFRGTVTEDAENMINDLEGQILAYQ